MPLTQATAAPTTTITADPSSIQEGGEPGNFIIQVTDPDFPCFLNESTVEVSVAFGGSAIFGVDYLATGATGNLVSVPMTLQTPDCEFGQASGTALVRIDPLADDLVEGDETVVLGSSTCSIPGFEAPPTTCAASATMTILDSTLIASIEASDPDASKETLDPGEFLVSLSSPAGEGGVTVTYSLSGSAVAGVDFAPLPGTLVIPAGQSSATISVTPLPGNPGDPDADLIVTVQPGQGYAVGAPASATVVIRGRPALPEASITAVSNASKETATRGEYIVNLSRPAGEDVTIFYNLSGSATPGVDFEPLSGTVRVLAGQASAPIGVIPISGEQGSPDTELTASLQPGEGYVIGTPASATLSITGRAGLPLALTVVSGNDQLATSRQSLQPFVVRATNSAGGVAGLVVLWEIVQGDGSLSTTQSTTNASGEASTVLTPGDQTQYAVRATLSAQGIALSAAFNAVASAPLADLPGMSPGQRSVAGALDALCPALNTRGQQGTLTSGEQDLLNQCRTLIANSGTNPGAVVQGVVALTPEQASAPRKLITQISSVQVDNLTERLSALRSGARGISLRGLSVGIGDQTIQGGLLASAIKQGVESGGAASADDAWPFERLGIFITGDVQWGSKNKTINEDGFTFDTLGLTAGADYRFTDGLILGAALGFASTKVDIDAAGGSLNGDSWSLSLYGTYYPTDNFYLEGSATYGWDTYDQDRNIAYSLLGGSRQAKANFDGSQYSLLFGAGYDLIRGGNIIDMYGRVRYTSASLDDYRERGASGLDLVIRGQDAVSFVSILGAQISRSISLQKAVLIPQGWIEWEHEFEKGDDEVQGYFAHDPNRFGFSLPTDALDTDLIRLGVGLGAQFGQGRVAFVSFQTSLGMEDYSEYNVTAGIRMEF
ncbi:autotransporter domain-containing protein [Thiocapsa rosea]|nr:autotransporter domain-containing protein [Thiocapsa rosea]